jgi:hypothetical protein
VRKSGVVLLTSICLVASAIATGQTTASDLKITTRQSFGSSDFTSTTYYSGANSRSEMQISSGNVKGHHRAIIRRQGPESIQVYDLDVDAHVYASYQTDLYGGVPGAGPRSFVWKPSGKIYQINIDVVDTGERKEMFGHIARHLLTKERRIGGPENCYGRNSENEVDGWYIEHDVLPLSLRPKAGASAHLVVFSVGSASSRCSDKIEVHRSGPAMGFALKERTTHKRETTVPENTAGNANSVSQTEVVEFVEATLDPGLFQVPSDFKKVHEIIDPTQRRLQALTYWEKFKAELWDFFR